MAILDHSSVTLIYPLSLPMLLLDHGYIPCHMLNIPLHNQAENYVGRNK